MATRWSHYQYLWLFRIPWTIFLAHRCHWCHNNWYALCSHSLPRRPSVRLLSLPISSAHYPNDLFSLSSFSPSLPTPPPRQPGRRRAHNYGFATARFLACLPSSLTSYSYPPSLPRGMRAYNRTSPAPLVAYGRVKTFVNPMSLILCLNRSIKPKMPFQFTLP